ncbi:MAG: energy transducer TonB [bacterium]|nr:energy transducer TonB [bacterium]MDW8164863.1 energy transducer TonB [Candidatus Omnitrophota bacterium]
MNYRNLSFLFSVSLHLMFGCLIFFNKIDINKKEEIFFVNLVEIEKKIEEPKKITKKEPKYKKFDKKTFENLHPKSDNSDEVKIEKEKEEIVSISEGEINEEKKYGDIEIPIEKIDVKDEKKIGEQVVLNTNGEKKEVLDINKKVIGSLNQEKIEKKEVIEVELNKFIDSSYFKLIKKKIDEKIFYPEIARRRNIEGKIKIQFILKKNGVLEELKILKSSGNEILDKTSLEIIKNASPFPEFPVDLNYEKISFIIEFNFKLK